MRKFKTTHGMYSAWNYQRELENLNKMSEQGWQLVEGRLFSCRFKKDDSIQYRYQLDYQPKIDDRPRYVDSFREFGWEYINSTINGWHYFRKPYDPSLPEEEYEIFSDRSSLKEMNNRWVKIGVVGLVFCSVFAAMLLFMMIMRPSLSTLALLLEYAVLIFFLSRGVCIMKNPDRSKNSKGDSVLTSVLLILTLVFAVSSVVLTNSRANINSWMTAEYFDTIPVELEDACLWNTINVKYTDNYFLDTTLDADAPITLSVVNEKGEIVYTVTGDNVTEEDVKVVLHRGEYRIYLSDFAGGRLEVSFDA